MKKALLIALLIGGVSNSGCAAIHTSMEKVRGIGTAVLATTEIVDAAADDVGSVWDGVIPGKATDPVAEPAK